MKPREDEYLDELGRFAAEARLSDLSGRAHEHMRWVLADCLPVIAAGMQVDEMKALVAAHLDTAAPGSAWVIGTGRRAAALDAALLNGTAGTWLELDEGNLFAKGHPGIQVVPAAVAVAQESAVSGAELLLAVSLGYEVCSRISRAAKVRMMVHPHGTYGVIGAAVAVGRLRAIHPDRRCASSSTLPRPWGWRRAAGHCSRGPRSGTSIPVIAALWESWRFVSSRLDLRGSVTGCDRSSDMCCRTGSIPRPRSPASAESGCWPTDTSSFTRPADTSTPPSMRWRMHSGKRPKGAWIARRSTRSMSARTRWQRSSPRRSVTSSFGARFSIPFALASILYHGRSGLGSFNEAAVANQKVQALAARVSVEEDPAFTAAYPAQQRCIVTLRLKRGATLEGHCTVTKGEPSNPHEPSELERKFFELGTPIWGDEATKRLYHACMTLETLPDFHAFAAGITL